MTSQKNALNFCPKQSIKQFAFVAHANDEEWFNPGRKDVSLSSSVWSRGKDWIACIQTFRRCSEKGIIMSLLFIVIVMTKN